ncbi:MAG: Spy/CpxP family protein refolding chaperone [Bacteroidota bacterium]
MKKQILFMVLVSILGLGCFVQELRAQEKQAAKADSVQAEKQVAKTDSISLLDTTRVAEYLGLSEAQQDSVKPMIAEVQNIVNEDKRIRDEMRAQSVSGQGQFNREAMQKVRSEREERQKKINALADEIKSQLSDEQKEKFASVLVPNLQEIARAERGQMRGRAGRRGQ